MQILDSSYHNRKVIAGSITLLHHTILLKKKTAALCKHKSSSKVEGWLFFTQFTEGHQYANELKGTDRKRMVGVFETSQIQPCFS